MLECINSDPVYWDESSSSLIPNEQGGAKPISNWAFSKTICSGDLDFSTSTTPGYIEKISSGDQSFYLEKIISYGDYLILSFFIIFILSFIIKEIRDFIKNRKLERL